jgi:hypothetical protein
MKRKEDGWNILLAGFWNRAIFVPEWVTPHIFETAPTEILIGFLPIQPLLYQDAEVSLEILPARLAFRPRVWGDDSALRRIAGMAGRALTQLPETPLHGVGVNLAFIEDRAPDELLALFNDADEESLASRGWTINERKLSRRFAREDDVLNLTMIWAGTSVTVELNFHSETTTAEAALKAVEPDRVVRLRDQSLKLLHDIYHLDLQEGGKANG